MKNTMLFHLILPWILLYSGGICSGQGVQEQAGKADPDPKDSLSGYTELTEFLLIQKASKLISQNSAELFSFNPSMGVYTSGIYPFRHPQEFFSDHPDEHSSLNFIDCYERIDVSNSKNLDYKKLAGKLPKPYTGEEWGYLLFDILGKHYSHDTFIPQLPQK